jgi:hypothetical protein
MSEVLTASSITQIMEAVSTSEKSVNFFKTTIRNIPEDNNLHTCCRENLKFHHNLTFVISLNVVIYFIVCDDNVVTHKDTFLTSALDGGE